MVREGKKKSLCPGILILYLLGALLIQLSE